ncbi:hypothetical protein [Colwellia piezophila]|uniref:hypothetical protein n=1 Tax=Colwellia piezophila TaxID=211668 RepID=UPI000374A3A3|nr:hypothetical protein [Colwellia piezophila]
MNQTKGFIASFVIVIIIFLVSAISAAFLADYVGIWKKPVIGAMAAFCVVISAYLTSPSHKRSAAVIWLIVGAISAWFLAGDSFYPEDSEQAYQLTIIPLAATYLSGLFALLICLVWHHKKLNKITRRSLR